jgi:phosphoserine/homoserine phosphotransferase
LEELDMRRPPYLIATDLEGILIPEIWIAIAEQTGIERLRLTTRDVPDYDTLMAGRLAILREHTLSLADIRTMIAPIEPLPGAREFLQWARARAPLVVLSDTFYEFVGPLMAELGHPALFCNSLEVGQDGAINGYHIRQPDGKRNAALAFKQLGFRVLGIGDSYNDTAMLCEADTGILFRPPAHVASQFPQFPVFQHYAELQAYIAEQIKE